MSSRTLRSSWWRRWMFSSSLNIGMMTESMSASIPGHRRKAAGPGANAQGASLDEARACQPHALHCAVRIAGLHVNALDTLFNDVDCQSELEGLQHRIEHAVIRGQ